MSAYQPRPLLHNTCLHCGSAFLGRKGKQFCSKKCVKAAATKRGKIAPAEEGTSDA